MRVELGDMRQVLATPPAKSVPWGSSPTRPLPVLANAAYVPVADMALILNAVIASRVPLDNSKPKKTQPNVTFAPQVSVNR